MNGNERQHKLTQLFATIIVGAVAVAAVLLLAAFVVSVWQYVL